jgi:hypothetical protein
MFLDNVSQTSSKSPSFRFMNGYKENELNVSCHPVNEMLVPFSPIITINFYEM